MAHRVEQLLEFASGDALSSGADDVCSRNCPCERPRGWGAGRSAPASAQENTHPSVGVFLPQVDMSCGCFCPFQTLIAQFELNGAFVPNSCSELAAARAGDCRDLLKPLQFGLQRMIPLSATASPVMPRMASTAAAATSATILRRLILLSPFMSASVDFQYVL